MPLALPRRYGLARGACGEIIAYLGLQGRGTGHSGRERSERQMRRDDVTSISYFGAALQSAKSLTDQKIRRVARIRPVDLGRARRAQPMRRVDSTARYKLGRRIGSLFAEPDEARQINNVLP